MQRSHLPYSYNFGNKPRIPFTKETLRVTLA